MANACASEDLLVILLSGGASALLALPLETLPLADKQAATGRLLRAGADIHALNTVRKHLSRVKGGRLAAASRARTICLAVSDVVGDDPSVIGSGPAVPDATTWADALEVLDHCGGRSAYPVSVIAALEAGRSGRYAETPKPGSPLLQHATTQVVGSRRHAMDGARLEAWRRGYRAEVVQAPVVGEARIAAAAYADALRAWAANVTSPLCLITSGETTVRVAGDGKGGRNQEFALALVEALARFGMPVVIASAGTDGIDGPTDAAGALVATDTLDRARSSGLDPAAHLARNDAYHFFQALGDLIVTGPTATNVGDIQVALVGAHRG